MALGAVLISTVFPIAARPGEPCYGDSQPLRALPVLGADSARFTAPRTRTCLIRQVRQRPQ